MKLQGLYRLFTFAALGLGAAVFDASGEHAAVLRGAGMLETKTTVTPVVGEFARRARPLSSAQEAAIKPGDRFRECDSCPDMIVVPAGEFTMGADASEPGSVDRERPRHEVRFAKPFAVGRLTVTFAEWDACVADGGCGGHRPADQGWGRGLQPVIGVSWHDAQSYVWWLTQKTGRPYRLLSEAEREYAARAGTRTAFWWGDHATPEQANYKGGHRADAEQSGSTGRPLPADRYDPNPWGLHQVHGNVFDWVEDCWNDTHDGAPRNGSARRDGNCALRVVRGGSWTLPANVMRSSSRLFFGADIQMSSIGFRVARTLR